MKVSLKMACLLVVLSFQGLLRAQESYPVIDTTDLPGARFTQPKTYTGASLFGYMNGGAESSTVNMVARAHGLEN